jgi:hypothetical protein
MTLHAPAAPLAQLVNHFGHRPVGAFFALILVCASASALLAPSAFALSKTARDANRLGVMSDAAKRPSVKTAFGFGSAHHDGLFDHLGGVQQNVSLVGELNLKSPSTGLPVHAGQIADVAVHNGFAYLNSWDSPTCQDGGTFVVDIRNPAAPKQVAFIPALAPYYHGEGAHVISVNTPQFKGDLLAVNNETYGSNVALTAPGTCAPADKTGGGFDLYDVTDPAHPKALVQNAGDRSPENSETQSPTGPANSFHSVFVWQDGPRAYLVGSDNTELADIDIFDITDPTNPEFKRDFDPFDLPEISQIVSTGANGNSFFHHDVVVKRIAGTMRMLVSYWDAGYMQLNVNDPANPTYITDTNFDDPDLLTGFDPPEGNAHYAEYSYDNQFVLGADEDFAPFRLVSRITQAPYANLSFAAALSEAEPISSGTLISGDTVFVGSACTGTVAPPPPGVTVAVAERGVCAGGFQEKADAIEAAGYEMGVIMNNSFGAGGGRCETLINMLIDPATVAIPMVFVGRATGLRILNTFNAGTYACTGAATETPADTDVPAVGTGGLTIEIGSLFDGWGAAHLYDANTSQEIDAYAIDESLDERYANDFGALSIHEWAADPTTNLAYSAYYAGGLRVVRFSRANGIEPMGRWIDDKGSDLWGVEQFTDAAGNRLIAVSDRDFGLQILKYTGPGAVLAPAPPATAPAAPPPPPVVAPVRPNSFFSFGALRRLTIKNGRASVTITVPGPGKATAVLKASIGRRSVTIASATGTATKAGALRFAFRVSASNLLALRRTLARRPTHRTSGVLRVQYTPTGGSKRTRNKSLSIAIGR